LSPDQADVLQGETSLVSVAALQLVWLLNAQRDARGFP
jgi:hypothetical protein